MRNVRKLAFFISLAVYCVALPIGFFSGDVWICRVLYLVIFTATWAYGFRAGVLCLLVSLPIDALFFVSYYGDWQAMWWTFHPIPRAAQFLLAYVIGKFKTKEERLEQTELDLLERTRQLEEALMQVRELKGIIRICATCKNICDEDGSWIPLESFITERSRALFSHGFCPTCYEHQMAQLPKRPEIIRLKNQRTE